MNDKNNFMVDVRSAEHKEARIISDLLYEAFVPYRSFYTERAFAVTTLSVEVIESRVNKNSIWVALLDGAIAGTLSTLAAGERLFIKSVAVAPEARRKGLGIALLRHAERIAGEAGARRLELTTTPFLYEASALYRHFGFEACGQEDLYGTPLIKMKKHLGGAVVFPEKTGNFNRCPL